MNITILDDGQVQFGDSWIADPEDFTLYRAEEVSDRDRGYYALSHNARFGAWRTAGSHHINHSEVSETRGLYLNDSSPVEKIPDESNEAINQTLVNFND